MIEMWSMVGCSDTLPLGKSLLVLKSNVVLCLMTRLINKISRRKMSLKAGTLPYVFKTNAPMSFHFNGSNSGVILYKVMVQNLKKLTTMV